MKKLLILGAKGYLGTQLQPFLDMFEVYTFDRGQGDSHHISGSITKKQDVIRATKHMDVVINLIGLSPLKQPKTYSYHQIHVQGMQNLIEAAKKNNVSRIVHISALGADSSSSLEYFKTKGIAEELLKKSDITYTILAPSLLYSQTHPLMKLFSLRCIPNIPALFSPIHVEDMIKYIVLAAIGKISQQRLDIGGTQQLTFLGMAKKIHDVIIPLPYALVRFGALIASQFHLFGITSDQIQMFSADNSLKDTTCHSYFIPRTFSIS